LFHTLSHSCGFFSAFPPHVDGVFSRGQSRSGGPFLCRKTGVWRLSYSSLTMEENYFHRFPGFRPNPSAPATSEFARLARHMNWSLHSKTYRREKANFAASEFNRHFGADGRLQAWQALCYELQLEVPASSITQCRKVGSNSDTKLTCTADNPGKGTLAGSCESMGFNRCAPCRNRRSKIPQS
jgi:hypothetical protein